MKTKTNLSTSSSDEQKDVKDFKELGMIEPIIKAINEQGIVKPTQIQEMSIPIILSGKDIIAGSKTGSGKTLAFGTAIIQNITKGKGIQAIVLTPTRELCVQVTESLSMFSKYIGLRVTPIYGGVSINPQMNQLKRTDVVVGTPGRVLDHLQRGTLNLSNVKVAVLDEADRMLDMGFSEDIHEIISYIPTMRQTLLFSATYPENIEELGHKILMDPITVEVESTHAKSTIVQEFYEVDEDIKAKAVEYALAKYGSESSIIFCNTKIGCDELADNLEDAGLDVLVLHSDLDQRDRDETLILFSNKSYPILIATDVAARGIDVKDIDLVINYDLPHDNEVYVHRIGRTARAGASGRSISFVEDKYRLDDLEDALDTRIDLENVSQLETNEKFDLKSKFSTIFINGGKKSKVRAGDILGALTAGVGLSKDDIGKIDILQFCSYVAVKKEFEQKAFDGLSNGKIKGKYFRVFLK